MTEYLKNLTVSRKLCIILAFAVMITIFIFSNENSSQSALTSKGFTKYSFSRKTNIRYDTICNYCKGNVSLINVEYLKIFCNVLGCRIEDIIEYEN